MGIIVAIGGGEITQKDTIEIDKEIISLSKIPERGFLVIPRIALIYGCINLK